MVGKIQSLSMIQRIGAVLERRRLRQEIKQAVEKGFHFDAAVHCRERKQDPEAIRIARSLLNKTPAPNQTQILEAVRIFYLLETEWCTEAARFWLEELPSRERGEAVQFQKDLLTARQLLIQNQLADAAFLYSRLGLQYKTKAILEYLEGEDREAERARLLALLGRKSEALEAARTAGLQDPDSVRGVFEMLREPAALAQCYLVHDRFADAAPLLEIAARQQQRRDLQLQAAECFTKTGTPEGSYRGALLYASTGQLEVAMNLAGRLQQLGGKSALRYAVGILRKVADIHLRHERLPKALEIANRLLTSRDREAYSQGVAIYREAAAALAQSPNSLSLTSHVAQFLETVQEYTAAAPLREKIAAQTGLGSDQVWALTVGAMADLHSPHPVSRPIVEMR